MTHYASKDLFWTFKFFMAEEEVLDFSMKGSPGWNQYQSAIEEGITYSRHTTQALIGKDLKSKFT